jgi:hypothetical protein
MLLTRGDGTRHGEASILGTRQRKNEVEPVASAKVVSPEQFGLRKQIVVRPGQDPFASSGYPSAGPCGLVGRLIRQT